MPKYILEENLNAEELAERFHYLVVDGEKVRVESVGNTGFGDLLDDGLDIRELHTVGEPVQVSDADLPDGRRWARAELVQPASSTSSSEDEVEDADGGGKR